jgi:hypothetical protein
MQTVVSSSNKGLNVQIDNMTQANLAAIATAYFNAFPNEVLHITHDDSGYHVLITGYPVNGTLSQLITSLQAIQSITGVGN